MDFYLCVFVVSACAFGSISDTFVCFFVLLFLVDLKLVHAIFFTVFFVFFRTSAHFKQHGARLLIFFLVCASIFGNINHTNDAFTGDRLCVLKAPRNIL